MMPICALRCISGLSRCLKSVFLQACRRPEICSRTGLDLHVLESLGYYTVSYSLTDAASCASTPSLCLRPIHEGEVFKVTVTAVVPGNIPASGFSIPLVSPERPA